MSFCICPICQSPEMVVIGLETKSILCEDCGFRMELVS